MGGVLSLPQDTSRDSGFTATVFFPARVRLPKAREADYTRVRRRAFRLSGAQAPRIERFRVPRFGIDEAKWGNEVRETEAIAGTRVQRIIDGLDELYAEVERVQLGWRAVSPFRCPDGCGSCCVDFEPDVLECEALYLAAWMLLNQRSRAEAILSGSFVSPRNDPERGCFLFDPDSPFHCTVYDGRCLICRLFGYSGDRGKDGELRWKPCKFIPLGESAGGESAHRQYSAEELVERYGVAPPAMGDITAQVVALIPDSAQERKPLREALPQAIAKILMLERFGSGIPDPDAPNPDAPVPRAS